MYEIIFSKKVERFLDKLDGHQRDRILFACDKLRIRPIAHLKKLVGSPYFRLRVGDYRLIIDVDNGKLRVLVIEIGHRKNVYK